MKLRQAAVPLAVLALVASLVVGLAIQPWFLVIPAAYLGSLVVAAASEPQARTLREKATMVAALATMHVMWGTALIASTAVHLVRGSK